MIADEVSVDINRLFEVSCDAHEAGDLERAMTGYLGVLSVDPEHVGALSAASLVHLLRDEYDLAEALARRSLAIAPTMPAATTLARVHLYRRQFDEALLAYRAAVGPELTEYGDRVWTNLLFALDLHPGATPELRLAERRAFDARYCRPLTEAAAPHANDRDPERILRVGYVSADVRQHSAAHCFGPVLAGHSERVETYLYDVNETPPAETDMVAPWLRGQVQHAQIVGHLDDPALAATIRHDQIDILVDLSGYSAGGRPLLFARKPAPIQLSGLGYAAGLGISAIDGILCDPIVVPPEHAWQYDEELVYLPSYIPFDPAPPWPDVAPPPRDANGYVTYGYLGRPVRISAQTLSAWSDILRVDPTSKLLLKAGEYSDPHVVRGIRIALFALGIDPDRITFEQATSRQDHLARYAAVDFSLDPFPHNGGVTTLESILMGVPVVVLKGDSICGRGGTSLMTTLNLQGLIARSASEYVRIARRLDTLPLDRPAIRKRLLDSILVDRDRYTRAVEDAYRQLWRQWCHRSA